LLGAQGLNLHLAFELACRQRTRSGSDAAELGRERKLGNTEKAAVFEEDPGDVGTALRDEGGQHAGHAGIRATAAEHDHDAASPPFVD
jgi:hypothetical protein